MSPIFSILLSAAPALTTVTTASHPDIKDDSLFEVRIINITQAPDPTPTTEPEEPEVPHMDYPFMHYADLDRLYFNESELEAIYAEFDLLFPLPPEPEPTELYTADSIIITEIDPNIEGDKHLEEEEIDDSIITVVSASSRTSVDKVLPRTRTTPQPEPTAGSRIKHSKKKSKHRKKQKERSSKSKTHDKENKKKSKNEPSFRARPDDRYKRDRIRDVRRRKKRRRHQSLQEYYDNHR